jgi:hypothetical protein
MGAPADTTAAAAAVLDSIHSITYCLAEGRSMSFLAQLQQLQQLTLHFPDLSKHRRR